MVNITGTGGQHHRNGWSGWIGIYNVSKVFNVLAWIQLVIGTILFLFVLIQFLKLGVEFQEGLSVFVVLGEITLCTARAFLICLAISQFLLMCINITEKIENIDNNLFYLATKKAEEVEQQVG